MPIKTSTLAVALLASALVGEARAKSVVAASTRFHVSVGQKNRTYVQLHIRLGAKPAAMQVHTCATARIETRCTRKRRPLRFKANDAAWLQRELREIATRAPLQLGNLAACGKPTRVWRVRWTDATGKARALVRTFPLRGSIQLKRPACHDANSGLLLYGMIRRAK